MNESYDPSDPFGKLNSDDFSNNFIPSGMEERLMQCQPRSPMLDIEAIVRIADNGDASKRLAAAGQDGSRRYTTPQLVSTIAASWVCGAVVGAACIFFSMSDVEPTAQESDPIASNQSDDVDSNASATKQTTETNPKSNDSWQFDWNTEQLQVGMSLPSRVKLVTTTNPNSDSRSGRAWNQSTIPKRTTADESSTLSESLDYDVPPVTPMTQFELRKEFSRDLGFRVH